MSRAANPFRPGVVALLLLVGVGAFMLLLYALGAGWTGGTERNGGAHASGNGLNGYSGLVRLLDETGHNVRLSRNPGELDAYSLLVLTPGLYASASDIDAALVERHYGGPTVLILPKWEAGRVPPALDSDARAGWVLLYDAVSPRWYEDFVHGLESEVQTGTVRRWNGYGLSGTLPEPREAQAMVKQPNDHIDALVTTNLGNVLAGETYDQDNVDGWPVIVIFEPDLVNNYGLANEQRARIALELFDSAMAGEEWDIVFDMTMPGFGRSENLLTLAFRPPFLAATLCLLLAALVLCWRAFHRFGPPLAEATGMTMGKRQLAANSAALIERVRRWHLLKAPFEDMITRRIANHLGIRNADIDAREAAIDAALARRGHGENRFTSLAGDLREARHPRDILRAAGALRQFERTLTS